MYNFSNWQWRDYHTRLLRQLHTCVISLCLRRSRFLLLFTAVIGSTPWSKVPRVTLHHCMRETVISFWHALNTWIAVWVQVYISTVTLILVWMCGCGLIYSVQWSMCGMKFAAQWHYHIHCCVSQYCVGGTRVGATWSYSCPWGCLLLMKHCAM